jgi:hypothetical protein
VELQQFIHVPLPLRVDSTLSGRQLQLVALTDLSVAQHVLYCLVLFQSFCTQAGTRRSFELLSSLGIPINPFPLILWAHESVNEILELLNRFLLNPNARKMRITHRISI